MAAIYQGFQIKWPNYEQPYPTNTIPDYENNGQAKSAGRFRNQAQKGCFNCNVKDVTPTVLE